MNKLRICLYGIKGSGLAALAMLLFDYGVDIYGYDKRDKLFTELELNSRNIIIKPFEEFNEDEEECDILIYSSAFKDMFNSLTLSYMLMEYHEFLSFIIKGVKVIGVSGTHGKTTCVGMLDALTNKEFSLIQGDGKGRYKKNRWMIVECCEYQDHFLSYNPQISFILSIELDHTDYFKDYQQYRSSFKKFACRSQKVFTYDIYHLDLNNEYLIGERSDSKYQYKILNTNRDGFIVDINLDGRIIKNETVPFIGKHMVKLYVFALVAALNLGIDIDIARERLKSFKPVKRRFNMTRDENTIYIDDYAHQPAQINNVFACCEQMNKQAKKVLIFKPDRLTRIKDFYLEFIKSFLLFDEVYLVNKDSDKNSIVSKMLTESPKIKLFNNMVGKNKKETIFCFLSSKKIDQEILIVKTNRKGANT